MTWKNEEVLSCDCQPMGKDTRVHKTKDVRLLDEGRSLRVLMGRV